jgi:putative cell wall-binding protein
MKLRRFLALALTLAMVLPIIPFTAFASADPDRVSGDDRYATAVEISKAGWDTADTVVLARGDDYADALAGAPLAHKLQAPILLTGTNVLPQVVEDEIMRLGATKVVILGGLTAVSQAVEDKLVEMKLSVERVQGEDRFDTAKEIALKVAPDGVETAVVAYGLNFPDALAAASYAAAKGYPILLVANGSIPNVTKVALQGLLVENTIVVGGETVVPAAVLDELPNATRYAGDNRFDTSVTLAEEFAPEADHFYVATGLGFADAVTGAVLAAKNNTGLLLVGNTLPKSVEEFVTGNGVKALTVLGGSSSVSDEVAEALDELVNKTSAYTLTITGPDTVSVNQAAEFAVTLRGDDTGVQDLFGTLEYEITGGQGTLEYKDGEVWKPLPLKGHFGPKDGFAITPDWDVTTQLRFTATEAAQYTATVTLKAEGEVVTSATHNFSTAAGVVPENFSVTRDESKNYFGYSVGFRLTQGLTPADLAAVKVELFKGEKVLMTNTATEDFFTLEDLQHTAPFNVYAEFEGYTEKYWTLGEWQGDLLDVPDKAVVTVTLKDGRELTVENTNLTGDVSTIQPKVWNQDQEKAYDTIQAAINAAAAGDTIFLTPGAHTGHLNITKSLNLVGADEKTVVVDASDYDAYGIYVKAENVNFSNFTLKAPTLDTRHTYGFKVEDSKNISFTNVTVQDSYHTGLDLNNVIGATVASVTVDGTVYGVGLAMTDCEKVTVTDSTFTNNAWGSVAVYDSGKEIVIAEGNTYDFIYTEGEGEFDVDLSKSGVKYVATDSASPEFTFYFDTLEKAEAASSKITVLSNLNETEFHVFEGMSIQAAVDAVEDGVEAEVLVHEGSYTEDLVIKTTGLTLTGVEMPEVTGKVKLNASNVTIQGFALLWEGTGTMIHVANANDVTIINNLFMGDGRANAIALGAGTPSNVTVQGNIFRFLNTGVYVSKGEDVTVSGNYFTDIVEAAVSIELWAKNVAVDDNYVSFANALIFFWSEQYSEELVFEDEVTYSGNEYFAVVEEVATDKVEE